MKFYKYWAKASEEVSSVGSKWRASRYGSSNVSQQDAKSQAHELARQTAEAFRRGEVPNSYLYSDRPLREEIIEDFGDEEDPYAVITRNAYGSLVLNTARILFADIDLPKEKGAVNPLSFLFGFLGPIFSTPDLTNEILGEESDDIPTKIGNLVQESPGLGLRLYRTAAGFRCLVTSREFDPVADEAQLLLSQMESDPLYVKLCTVQECFRARLTPKFWRCGMQGPPVRFPWADAAQEQSMRDWERDYNRTVDEFATCEFLESLGSSEIESQIEPIVELHDRLSCRPGKQLA